MIPTIAFVIGAALGVAVGWSLGFDLGWNRGTEDMVQKSRALAAAEAQLATVNVAYARVCLELDTIHATRSTAARQAWATRKTNAAALTIDPRETLRADLLAEATHGGADGR